LLLGVNGQLLAKGKLHDRLLAAASEEGERRTEHCCDQSQESYHGIQILRDIALQQQSDSAAKPAVSFRTGRRGGPSNPGRTHIENAQGRGDRGVEQ
jgi:hypothetical protein